MGYIDTLSRDQLQNVNLLIDTMDRMGIINENTQASILAIISKESAFRPQAERGYGNTSNERIRNIFSKTRNLSDAELNALKKDDKKFFNFVYGKRYGNDGYSSSWNGYKESWDLPYKDGNDGWRYRGRGFNQITFKGNYRSLANEVGIDIVKHPEKLGDPRTSAEIAVLYFINRFKSGFDEQKQYYYNADHIDDFKTVQDSTLAVYHANAGFGKPNFSINQATSTGGLSKSLDRAPEFVKYVEDYYREKSKKKSL